MAPCAFGAHNIEYVDGSWQPFSERRYKIVPSFWEQLGTAIRSSTPQNYGRCDRVQPNRSLYEWRPRSCSLERFNVPSLCEHLRGRSLLMVGDSTVFQLWLSFALLLGSQIGKNVKKASTVSEITASACGDQTRLIFVRNDLLLLTSSSADFNSAKRCDGYLTINSFVARATRDADVVVLGVGHHFPGSLDMALARFGKDTHFNNLPREVRMRYHAFFSANLNHTLSYLLKARAAWGHAAAAASVLLVGTTTPVAGCSRFNRPIGLTEAVDAIYNHRRTVDSPMWLSYSRMNLAASWVARGLGVHFLDLAAASAQRPDGAMARFWGDAGKIKEDCVHYCMPGAVDAWSTLVFNWIRQRVPSSLPPPALEAGALPQAGRQLGQLPWNISSPRIHLRRQMRESLNLSRHEFMTLNLSRKEMQAISITLNLTRSSRFFTPTLERWLGERGGAPPSKRS